MKTLLESIARLRVLVIGDIMLDHYIWGDAHRISPEAPVPVVSVERDTYVAGGAANVALNVRSIGAKVTVAGRFGRDEAGETLATILGEAGVVTSEALRDDSIPTIVKTRVIVRNQQLCRLDREQSPRTYALEADRTVTLLESTLQGVDAIIFSDYAKGLLTTETIQALVNRAKSSGAWLALDPKPRRQLSCDGLDLMTPNRTEALELAGLSWNPHDEYPAEGICQAIWNRYHPKHLVITLGAEGMLLSQSGKVDRIMPTYAQEVFDVSGAGDTVIAALTLALAAGATIEEAAHFANTAAGVVVAKLGTATASPEEILSFHPGA